MQRQIRVLGSFRLVVSDRLPKLSLRVRTDRVLIQNFLMKLWKKKKKKEAPHGPITEVQEERLRRSSITLDLRVAPPCTETVKILIGRLKQTNQKRGSRDHSWASIILFDKPFFCQLQVSDNGTSNSNTQVCRREAEARGRQKEREHREASRPQRGA